MKTIQIKSMVWLLGLVLSTSDIAGQRVITNHPSAKGYPVIDLTDLSPLGCILTSAEAIARRTVINEQTSSNDEPFEIGQGASGINGTWNAKMPPMFQVTRTSLTGGGGCYWSEAYNYCKEYRGEGGGATPGLWRLPTQRELIIIWGLQPQLVGKGGYVTEIHPFWSCTEVYGNEACYLEFYDGASSSREKMNLGEVRCVRDL